MVEATGMAFIVFTIQPMKFYRWDVAITRRSASPGYLPEFAGIPLTARCTWFDTYPRRGSNELKGLAGCGPTPSFSLWGKPPKLALTVIMRKLIILANALIRDNRQWSEVRP
jgi:hypothetical protein